MKVSFIFAILALCLALPLALFAQEANPIQLPSPQTSGGMPLMQALKERKSTRAFSQREIPLQVLSDLLWAADGINRSDSVGRTAPSAHNAQEIDIYLIKADGVYLYVPKANTLIPVLAQDVRGLAGKQDFVKTAPLNLIFVADLSKLKGKDADFYAAADTGFISEGAIIPGNEITAYSKDHPGADCRISEGVSGFSGSCRGAFSQELFEEISDIVL
jgi:hypothetical protein